ncbi:MAG: hypothetical protein ABS99_05650 [Acetobacteraceae bacterium SCN 69-10]|nr:MAG: hypothetical protein ABS99_05650 [Acetobacteraceae bacterium SCN 69-10]
MLGLAIGGSAAAIRWWPPAAARHTPARTTRQALAAEPPLQRNPLVQLVAHTRGGYRDGSYTGPAFSAYYGWVQVQANIRGGSLVSVRVLRYPSDRSTSRRIAHIALPRLEREVIRAQSAHVHAVSGATLTSDAFLRSMDAALRRAAS